MCTPVRSTSHPGDDPGRVGHDAYPGIFRGKELVEASGAILNVGLGFPVGESLFLRSGSHGFPEWRSGVAGRLPPLSPSIRPQPDPPAGAAVRAPGRRENLGQAGGLQLRARLRRQQDPQAGVPGARCAGPGRRHAGLDRRGAVQPHPPGGRGRRPAGPAGPAGPGELGRLARPGQRPGRQHPALPDHGRGRAPGRRGLRHRLQEQLGAGARGRPRRGRHPVRHPGRGLRPPARRPRLRRLGLRGASSRRSSSGCSSTP